MSIFLVYTHNNSVDSDITWSNNFVVTQMLARKQEAYVERIPDHCNERVRWWGFDVDPFAIFGLQL